MPNSKVGVVSGMNPENPVMCGNWPQDLYAPVGGTPLPFGTTDPIDNSVVFTKQDLIAMAVAQGATYEDDTTLIDGNSTRIKEVHYALKHKNGDALYYDGASPTGFMKVQSVVRKPDAEYFENGGWNDLDPGAADDTINWTQSDAVDSFKLYEDSILKIKITFEEVPA